jgi:hypothetical protein
MNRPPNPNDQTDEPTIPHRYLTTASGAPLKFYEVLDEPCPSCGKGPTSNHAKLAVLFRAPGQETVHCTSCDFSLVRRPKPKRLPPMNSRR